jgi:hypothetical protein
MAVPTRIQHEREALDRLISQYQDRPRIAAWIGSYARMWQGAEDALWDIIASRLLASATGVHLNLLGQLVGQPRQGQTDDVYRVFIRGRIAVNRSRGRGNNVIRVAKALLDVQGGAFCKYLSRPNGFVLEVHDIAGSIYQTDTTARTAMAAMICAARSLTTQCEVIYFDPDVETFFTFATSDSEVTSADLGFTAYDGSGGGGFVNEVIH